jgi:hypothetical protein
MAPELIILIVFASFWIIMSLVTYHAINKIISPKNRKFYPHPLVGLVKHTRDEKFSFRAAFFVNLVMFVVYLPITAEWFTCWCLYKFWKFMMMDDCDESAADDKKSEVVETVDENKEIAEKEENIDKAIVEIDAAIENPEHIPNEEMEKQAKESEEFIENLKSKQKSDNKATKVKKSLDKDEKQSKSVEEIKDITEPALDNSSQASTNDASKIADTIDTCEPLMRDTPILISDKDNSKKTTGNKKSTSNKPQNKKPKSTVSNANSTPKKKNN